jgi:hypothetical protein
MDKCDVLDSQISVRMPILRAVLAVSTRTFDFCLPTKATTVPHTPDWLHEVKYDGYRLRLERDGDRVRSKPHTAPKPSPLTIPRELACFLRRPLRHP